MPAFAAMTAKSDYGVDFHLREARRLGLSDQALIEAVEGVQLFNAVTKIADALRLQPDSTRGDRTRSERVVQRRLKDRTLAPENQAGGAGQRDAAGGDAIDRVVERGEDPSAAPERRYHGEGCERSGATRSPWRCPTVGA